MTTTALAQQLARTRARLADLGHQLARQVSRDLTGAAERLWRQAARARVRRAGRIRFPQHRLTWGLLDLLDPGRLPSLRGVELHPVEAADPPTRTGQHPRAARPAHRAGPDRAAASSPAGGAARPASADRGRRSDRARPRPEAAARSARPARRPATRAAGQQRGPVPVAPPAVRAVTPLGARVAAAIAEGPPGGGRWTGRALADHVGCSRSTAWAYLRDRQPHPARPGRGREHARDRER